MTAAALNIKGVKTFLTLNMVYISNFLTSDASDWVFSHDDPMPGQSGQPS